MDCTASLRPDATWRLPRFCQAGMNARRWLLTTNPSHLPAICTSQKHLNTSSLALIAPVPMSTKPKLAYFAIQGRAEPIRMALAAAGVEFEFIEVNRDELKSDFAKFHFGQVPRYEDDQVAICQSSAILRHVGRKYGLYGADLAEQAAVDEVMEGVTDIYNTLLRKVLVSKEDPKSAKDAYWQEHWNPESATAPDTRGAHAVYLSRLLAGGGREGAGASGFVVGSGLTIADFSLTQLVAFHILLFGRDRVEQQSPDLVAHHDRVLALPRVAAYLEGPQRFKLFSPFIQPFLHKQ